MELSTTVNFQSTSNLLTADSWLRELDSHPLLALDFEAAVKYTTADYTSFQAIIDSPYSTHLEKRAAQARMRATALDHPSHITITHLSVAWSDSDAYVFIIDSPKLLNRILYWLTTTKVTQVWHNFSYDGKLIHHFTGKFPHHVEDTQLLAKTILNHVEVFKAKTGLKELAGTWYGDWAISADNFTLSQMYEPHVLRYAATDACATFKLWTSINSYLASTYSQPTYPEHQYSEICDLNPEAII